MQHKPSFATSERWFDSACVQEMDSFINTLSATTKEEQQLRPDLIGSTIMHYASKWLPELAQDEPVLAISSPDYRDADSSSSASITASWLKKKFFVESITGILPPEKESIPCDFLLRLLRIGNMVCADPTYLEELERRASWTLDQASLKELMIPSFSHTCDTLLDVDLVIRLVRRFVSDGEGVVKGSSGAFVKVGKLVDCYLAEVAVDGGLSLSRFEELANLIPSHVRVTDDGLYRAIDTYLKAHPLMSKQERKTLWDLIDARKLSQEASFHASQNKRLPVRTIIQVLLSERTKLNRNIIDWSGPSLPRTSPVGTGQFEHAEMKKLKEDVLKLQSRCMVMESQMEKLMEMKKKKKSSSGGYFGLKKIGIHHALFKWNKINGVVEGELAVDGFGFKTPVRSNRRRSMS